MNGATLTKSKKVETGEEINFNIEVVILSAQKHIYLNKGNFTVNYKQSLVDNMPNLSLIEIRKKYFEDYEFDLLFFSDYKILGIIKRQFPGVPILGLTATATTKVLDDVKKMLQLKPDCNIFRASFNRPNLFFEVFMCDLQCLISISLRNLSHF